MQRVAIEISDNFVHFTSEGCAFFRNDLKKINKHVAKTIGPKTADVLIRFLQVWDEEELDSVLASSEDVPERTPNKLVRRDPEPNTRSRKRRRRSRKAN